MSKRKKLRTSGEGIRPPKPTKNPRLGDSHRAPPTSELGHLHHPEELEDFSGPTGSAELSREEPGQAGSSCPDEDTGAASRFPGQPEKEPAPLPPSQNSGGRFVPQFARLRKTVTRKAEETLPEPSTQQGGSQLLEGSPGLILQEARGPGDKIQADGACPEQSTQDPVTHLPGSRDSQPEVSPEVRTGPSNSKRPSQDPLQGTETADGGNLGNSRPEIQRVHVPGDCGQKGHLPSNAEEKEPDSRAPQERGAQGGGAGADLPGGPQEEGHGIPSPLASAPALGPATTDPMTWSAAQDQPDPRQMPSGTVREAKGSCSSPACASLGNVVITDLSTDLPRLEQGPPELTGPPASPGRQAPGRGYGGTVPLAGETAGGRVEAGLGEEPPADILVSPTAFQAPAPWNREPTVDTAHPGHLVPEMGPGVDQTQAPSPDGQSPGGMCMLPSWHRKTAELGSQSHRQDLQGLSLSPQACGLLEHSAEADGPPLEIRAHQGSPDTPMALAHLSQHLPDPTEQAAWLESSALELDFLLDSQIQDALDVPDLEAPPEQSFPAGTTPGLVADAEAQPRPCMETQAPRVEDATNTVRGLIVELSNLNRLIMSTHRDLEAFKRLNPRKAKPLGKAPLPYPAKGVRSLFQGEQGWRDL